MSFLISNAVVVTVDAERRILEDGAIYVEDDFIREIGPSTDLVRRHAHATEIDATGKVVFPGLVNTHTHTFQTLLKGLGDDKVLYRWFTEMTGPSAVQLTEEDCYWAAANACLESIRSGATTVADFMYVHPRPFLTDAVIRGFQDAGVRGQIGRGYLTSGEDLGVPGALVETIDQALEDCQRLVDLYHRPAGRIGLALAPCFVWGVDEAALLETRAFADKTGIPIHIHASETDFEIEFSMRRHGMRDLAYMDSIGLLGPDVVCVHCVRTAPEDLRILKNSGSKVSHNPTSNMYLASGVAPVPDMIASDVAVGLATDGPASNNNQNMIHTLKMAALLHKVHTRDATTITAEKVLEMATIDGARVLGLEDSVGSIEVGKKADLVITNLRNVFASPVHNPVSSVVYSALGNEPETVLIDGRVVMQDGKITTTDEEEVLTQTQRVAVSLSERAGTQHMGKRLWRSPGVQEGQE